MNATWLAVIVALALLVTGLPGTATAAGGGDEKPSSSIAPAKPVDPDYAAAVKSIKTEKYAPAIPLLEGVVKRRRVPLRAPTI